jgi:DNA-binding transcriptional LysR family regulator
MAEQGLGVVLGQRRLASVLLERGALVILDPREMPLQSGYFAISAHYNAKNPGVQALLKLLNSLAGQ